MKYHVLQALMANLAWRHLSLTAPEWNLIADIAADDDDVGVAIVATMAMHWCDNAQILDVAVSRARTSFAGFRSRQVRDADTPTSTLPLIIPQLSRDKVRKCHDHYRSLKMALTEGNAYCQRSFIFLLGGFAQGLDFTEQLELILHSVETGVQRGDTSSSDEWARMGVYGYSRCGELLDAITASNGREGSKSALDVASLLKRERSQELIFAATRRYASDDCLLPLVPRLFKQWSRFESTTGITLAFPR